MLTNTTPEDRLALGPIAGKSSVTTSVRAATSSPQAWIAIPP